MDALITRRGGSSSEYNGKFDYSLYDWCGGPIISLLTDINLKDIDTSELRSMDNMFQDCSLLQSLNLSNFNTSNVTSMSYMFYYYRKLQSLDLSSFDTSKVNNMEDMFGGGCSLKTLYVRSEADKTKLTASSS